jgi:dTDP-4-amino-4,6-dideoxygalactose transaminase
MSVVKRTYDWFGLGKVVAVIAKRLHLISLAVLPAEKRGEKPLFIGKRLPNALALLALHQLDKLDRLNAHRREIAKIYENGLRDAHGIEIEKGDGERVWLRYSIKTNLRAELLRKARTVKIVLGDWYDVPIAPKGVDERAVGYVRGVCPNAERLSQQVCNLPTHIGIRQADVLRIISVIKEICH